MDFNAFLNQAWTDHGKDLHSVALRMKDGAALIENGAHIGQLAHLLTHVYGEHLGSWSDGERELKNLLQHKNSDEESRQAIARSLATLRLSADENAFPIGMSKSNQAHVIATAASARLSHGHLHSTIKLLNAARVLCGELPKDDPAQKALAATANNLSCLLEEKADRAPEETELMLLAARTALAQWALAGGWRQVQAAHYRMAKAFLQAGLDGEAYAQALTCLQVNEANGGGEFEFFSSYECLASAEIARGNRTGFEYAFAEAEKYFSQFSADDQAWAQADMERLRKFLT